MKRHRYADDAPQSFATEAPAAAHEGETAGASQVPDGSVVVGRLVRDDEGAVGVAFSWGGVAHESPVRLLVQAADMPDGQLVALLFEGGDVRHPIVVGPILAAPPERAEPRVTADDETVRITATRSLELECGKAKISLSADGKVRIRGESIVTRADGPNWVKGGSVQIN